MVAAGMFGSQLLYPLSTPLRIIPALPRLTAVAVPAWPRSRLYSTAARSPRSRSMPKVSKGKVWHGVQVQASYSITGGFLRRPMTCPVEEFQHDGRAIRATKISSCTDWLCQVAASTCYSSRPLGRCTVFRMLWRKLAAAARGEAEPDDKPDKMSALSFDDELPSPAQRKSIHSLRKQAPKGAAVAAPVVVELLVKDCPSAVAETRRVIAVLQGKDIYLELDGLSWLANYIREELPTGGVQLVTEAEPAVAGARIFWDWRDEVWVCRPPRSEGDEPRRKPQRRPVRTRMMPGGDLHHLDFEAAKRVVYDELVATFTESSRTPSAS